MDSLLIATLVIYIILIQPLLYCLWRHGKRGILGWFYLQSFCILRIVGSAVELNAEATNSTSTSILILNSIGLSPLLLGTVGILHEARSARNPRLRQKIEWFLVLNYHVLVSAAFGLVITGIVKMDNGNGGGSDEAFLKIGMAIILLCWILLLIWTLVSLRSYQKDTETAAYTDGTKLLYGVVVALPFVGCREIYAACSTFITSSDFTSSLAIKVCMSVVPEMILTVIFIVVGIMTRNISEAIRRGRV